MTPRWEAYRDALAAFHAEATPETEAAFVKAHEAWVREYVPSSADALIDELRDLLAKRKTA